MLEHMNWVATKLQIDDAVSIASYSVAVYYHHSW
jgi:hypothetical protein